MSTLNLLRTPIPIQATMSPHRRQSSLEGILDFPEPFSLSLQQSDSARSLLDIFIKDYGLERATERGYKPAKLIHATLDYISSKDSFLTLFFTFLHENLAGVTSNITLALSYFEDFSSWDPATRSDVRGALEEFADYMVTQFFLPRAFVVSPACNHLLTQTIQLEPHLSRHRNQRPPRCPQYKHRPPQAQNSAYLS